MSTNWELADDYGIRQNGRRYEDVALLYASLVEEYRQASRSVWDRMLGLTTIVMVSAGGWTALIALARLLR